MANTVIGFTIDINGIDNIDKLNKEIKDTNEALKGLTVGTKEYAETSEKLAKLRAEQKALRKNQTELTKSFLEQSNALNAYDKASAKLNRLRKEFKNLAIQGKESTKEGKKLRAEINKLDKQLKTTDAKVGQFQRNVGNYPRVFGLSTKAIIKQIPVLDKLNKRLEKTTGVSNLVGKAFIAGFAAFKAAEFLGRAFEQFDELIKKIDETRNAVARFSGASGERLDELSTDVTALSKTFEVDSEQLTKSAAALSEKLGISFEDALLKIENGLKAGQASNEEYLSTIEQTPEAFQEAGAAVGDYAEKTGRLLDANKELAAAQIELANEFSGSASEVKAFASEALASLIRIALQVVNSFKPVLKTFFNIGKSIGQLIGSLFGAGDAVKGFGNIFDGLGKIIKLQADLLLFFINSLRAGVDFLRGDASTAFKLFTKEGRTLAKAQEQLAETTKDLTAEYQNETAELNSLFGQLANTNKNTKERSELIKKLNERYGEYLPNIDLEKAGQEDLAAAYAATTKAIAQNLIDRKKIELTNKAQNEVLEGNIELEKARQNLLTSAQAVKANEENIKQLRAQGAGYGKIAFEIRRGAKVFREFQAAQKDFNKVQKEVAATTAANKKEIELLDKASGNLVDTLSEFIDVDKLAATAAEEAAAREVQAAKDAEKEKEKIRQEATKKALAEQKRRQEQLKKEREKFLKDEAAFITKQTQILQKLQQKQSKLITDAIADEQTKQRTLARQASEQRITAAEKEFNALKEAAEKRTAEAARLFGENSEQAKQAAIQGAQDIAAAESTLNDIRRRERIELTNELLEIDKQFREKQQAADEKQFNEQLARTKAAADLAQSKLDERLAKGLISEQEAAQESFNITKERIQKELELIEQRQQALAAQGIELTESENAAILAQKQALYTELAQLEKGYTEQVEQEAEARKKATADEAAKRLKDFQDTFADIAGNLQQGFQLLTDLANASDERRKARLEQQAEDNAKINENLNERLQAATGLERQFLEQQIQANESAAEQIAKKKEEIEKQQAKRAKARAIIESIIATALAVTKALPDAVTATIAGIVGAAQTAIIAAQPLAKGGKVGTLSGEIVQFNTGGKVTNKGNIKPLSNGDNVLATLKTGEVVLTQEQQARIGGASVLRAAGVPNFAQGGLVGAPSNIIQQTTEAKANSLQMLESIQKAIEATNNRVDRLQVVWTSESQAEQDKGLNDREQIRTNATF